MRLAGVDGCRDGWLVAEADGDLQGLSFSVCRRFADVLAALDTARSLVAVDMPVGLAADGARACDQAARKLLGRPRASSVFPPPCRPALAAASYEDACRLNAAACGRALSRECYGILPKIREVDALMTPARQAWIREAHPELIFGTLAGCGRGCLHNKRTPAGEQERRRLLPPPLISVDLRQVVATLRPFRARRDDVVDALACLVCAQRISRGTARVLPAGQVPHDERGLRMEIVA